MFIEMSYRCKQVTVRAWCHCRWPSHTCAVGNREWLQLGSLQKGHHSNLPDRIQASLITEWQAGSRKERQIGELGKRPEIDHNVQASVRMPWSTKVSSWTHEAHPHTLFLFPLNSPITALWTLALFKRFFFSFPLSVFCYFRAVCRSVMGIRES